MNGVQVNTENVHSRDNASMIAIRWHMSREEKNEVPLLGCTWYLQPDTLCSPPGSHRNARFPETLFPSTTLYKAGQANEKPNPVPRSQPPGGRKKTGKGRTEK